MWHDRARSVRAEGMAGMVEPTVERWLTARCRASDPEAVAMVRDMVARCPPDGYAAACAALAEADMTAVIEGYGGPTTVICGAHDGATPPERGAEIASLIPGATVEVLDASHVSALERPVAFAAAVEAAIRAARADAPNDRPDPSGPTGPSGS